MPTIKEALEAAYDKLDAEPEKSGAPAAERVVETTPEVKPAGIAGEPAPVVGEPPKVDRDELGRFKPATEKSREEKPHGAPKAGAAKTEVSSAGQATATGAASPPLPAPVAAPVLPETKPPASWRTLEREAWGKIPAEAQQAVLRREKEITQTLNQSAEARKSWEKFQQAAEPFKSFMAATGNDPIQSATQLWQTAAQLQMGTPDAVASIAASIIANYGVSRFGPQFVEKVAAYLNGQPGPQIVPQPPSVDVRTALREELESMRAKALEAKAQSELEKFESSPPEFWDHPGVRQRTARILEANDEEGVALSYQEAYDLAVASHPEIKKVLEQRAAAQSVIGQQAQATQKAKAAASSVRSQPAAGGNAQPKGLHAVLEEKADELGIK